MGLTVQAAYDMVGNNISVTDGRDATATYTCDALSRLTGASQPLSTGVTPCFEKSRADIILLVLHTPPGNIRFITLMGVIVLDHTI